MNKYERRGPTSRRAQRSSSTQSPRQVRPKFCNVVPSGTVASRVRFLESHSISAYTLPRRPTPNRIRGQSRTGFGRRMTSRFGKPASRNEYPDEEPQVDAEHSFLGHNSIRTKHLNEHGMTDGIGDRRDTYSRASGIQGQMQPQGMSERVQCDAASPWSVTPKQHKPTCWRRSEMDVVDEIDGSVNKGYFKGLTSIFPTLTSGIGHLDMYRREVKSRQDNISDFSALTASTVRRQSVRDLFDHYGIERPHGLVPDEAAPREHDDIPSQAKSKIRCRNCAWYNNESSNWCLKCKMVIRTTKHMGSPSLISAKGKPSYRRNIPEDKVPSSPDSSAKENQPRKHPKKRNELSRPGPTSFQKPTKVLRQVRKLSSPTTKFPSFSMTQSPNKSQSTSRKITLVELPIAPRLLNGSRTTTIVKESPFLIADQLWASRSSQVPVTVRMDRIYCRKTQSKGGKMDSTNVDCKSPSCRATHEDHDPYRHSVACSSRTKHVPEGTDNGYVGDASFAEDSSQNHSSQQHKAPSRVSKQASNRSLNLERAEISHQSLGSEYVECRGYPRTGHARHGSATSGALGQCQHCIDDCQCTSCQNTHHSVRCCMNENHQGMVHHHHSPREKQSINLLDCPTFSSQYAESSEKFPQASIARTASAVIPPASQLATIPSTYSAASRMDISIQPPTKKPTMEKPRILPRSKQDTFLKEVAKPPTPPPWVSDPKIRTKSPSPIRRSNLQSNRTAADTASDVQAIPDPPSSFKELPTLPPLPTCDILNPEQSWESTICTWVKMPSDHVHEHNNLSCTVYSCDQSASNEKQPRLPNARSTSRASKASTPDSMKVSRRFSELFRSGEKKTVLLLLNQRLLEHQEKLRRMEKQCDDRIEVLAGGNREYSQNVQPEAAPCEEKSKNVEGKTGMMNCKTSGSTKKRTWGLTLVDKKPTPPCHNDGPVKEHMLSDDATVPCANDSLVQEHTLTDDEIVDEKGNLSMLGTWVDSTTKTEEHDCVWKARFVASQNGSRSQRGADQDCVDMPLQGVTVVVHMEGKDDLVIEADLRKGAVVKARC